MTFTTVIAGILFGLIPLFWVYIIWYYNFLLTPLEQRFHSVNMYMVYIHIAVWIGSGWILWG